MCVSSCGISTEKSLTMFLENEQQKEVPQWWGIIYREIVPQVRPRLIPCS
jgi:hypothetical protein